MTLSKEGYIWLLIRDAKATGQSTAAFHAAVLDYPEVFENKTGEELKKLCVELGAPESYATEAKKMLALKRYRENRPPSLDDPNIVY
jgi:hypothetical protein